MNKIFMGGQKVQTLLYDANFSMKKFRGMGKYINNFISVLTSDFSCRAIGLLTGNTEPVNDGYRSFGFSNYILWEQFSLLLRIRKKSGIMIFPYNTAPIFLCKKNQHILLLHDLIFLNDLPTSSLKQKIGKTYRKFVVPRIVRKFKYIITVSEYSKNELMKMFNISSEKIHVIPNSVSFSEEQISRNIKLVDRENFFFHIGGEPEYKNSKSLLFAFAALPECVRKKYSLIMIGIRDKIVLNEYQNITVQLGIYKSVSFLPYQSEEDISYLYSKAKLFLFPSLHEGFGIPIIEAFKFGCPVICSNQSCMPEIGGNAAHYYDPFVPNELSEKIINVLNGGENVESKINNGYEIAGKFSQANFRNNVIKWFENYCAENLIGIDIQNSSK